MRWIVGTALLLAAALPVCADLTAARAEANLEKRSKLAMDNAISALHEAREAYKGGDTPATTNKVSEVEESVNLVYTSLMQTGKDPRKSPRWFKYAEIETRNLLRSLESFQHDMNFEDRTLLDKTKERVQQVHDELLTGLMEGKRK
jgi:hypothetical protein